MKAVGIDIGSTTVKATVVADDAVVWQDYQRHNAAQAEKVVELLERMEGECGLLPGRDRAFFTGSGAGALAPLAGGVIIQEVVAVAAAVEKLHPRARFVSEIGGEDMKTIFLTPTAHGIAKQFHMQAACSGGTGTFIEKIARKLEIPADRLCTMRYDGLDLHKISSKCGIFAEADANSLLKAGVPVEEIVASLFDAVVLQNLSTLTKGNTPAPEVVLLGGPNLFLKGLQDAWRHHLIRLWSERKVELPAGKDPQALVVVPVQALYYASLGCIEIGKDAAPESAAYQGTARLKWWIDEGRHEEKAKEAAEGLVADAAAHDAFLRRYGKRTGPCIRARSQHPARVARPPAVIGCDFGSTTAKAVVLSAQCEVLFDCYALSRGNPIEDARALMRQIRAAGFETVQALALTGYGKDLLKDIIGADVAVVETVAHALAAVHFVPDVDVICDVGGTDVKVMILRQGKVADFRLNSQCSSGNGAFLQGAAERFGVPLTAYAERAFGARSMPKLAMGCGVFLQSDIVNQQRKGWSAEEIMTGLASVLPVNVWIYAAQLPNLKALGRKFVLQGGTHRNLAVVKAQVDFITAKVRDAEVVIHPYPGEAGAIGAALSALERHEKGRPSRFRGYETIESLSYRTTTNAGTTCQWCAVACRRTFIDVRLPGAAGRPWSKVPLDPEWERVISGNACPKGLVEDIDEMRQIRLRMEEVRREHPNVGELVRDRAFRSRRGARAPR